MKLIIDYNFWLKTVAIMFAYMESICLTEKNLFCFMFRLLNLLLLMCQLKAKIEAKKISRLFTSEAYDYLSQVPAGLWEPTKRWGKIICEDSSLEVQVKFYKMWNFRNYNCLTSIFFQPNVSLFKESNYFFCFILDPH